MESINASGAAGLAQGILKDMTGAQLISKTLDRLNTYGTLHGPEVNAGYQFRKDVLNAAGIALKLDRLV